MTWSSAILPKLQDENGENPLGRAITNEEASWIASLPTIGSLLGTLICGILGKVFGRKPNLLIFATFLFIAYVTLIFAKVIALYYLSRLLGGFSIAGLYSIMPVFIGEITEVHNRGILITSSACFMAAGQLFAYSIGPYIGITAFHTLCSIFPAVFLLLFFVFIPETPVYLTSKEKYTEAHKCLKKLRRMSDSKIQKEISEIEKEIENNELGSVKDLIFNKGLMKALGITITLLVLQQFTGIVVVLVYTQTIFDETGSSIPPEIAAIIIGVIQFLFSFVPPLIIDRWGRRILLLSSTSGIVISYIFLGLYFYLQEHTEVDLSPVFWLPVVSLAGYLISFNIGFSTVPYTLIGEVFPSKVRSYASAFSIFPAYVTSFIAAKYFIAAVEQIGMGVSFWIFGVFGFLAGVFSFVFVPETKGKTFQEIQDMFKS